MPKQVALSIPSDTGNPISLELGIGDVIYVLGANGSGKSSLMSRVCREYRAPTKRISAHRQTWFESNTVDMTARSRQDLERNVRSHDVEPRSRYREWNSGGRASMAIFDLIDADTALSRKIADLVRSGNLNSAVEESAFPSPIEIINNLMRLSNIQVEINIEEGQAIVARKNGGNPYSVAELSDGERSAFLIAADVLTAKAGTLVLIDEPERHLHRSIISPLLKQLFDRRRDCIFMVSTHELMLPLDTPSASTLLVRSCQYEGSEVRTWTADLIPPGAAIEDGLKNDILGARRKILFVEGTGQSLDLPLYSILFPQVSIIPKQNCRDVEYAVRGLRGASFLHWVSAWGIIDNDQRDRSDIDRLKTEGVWALSHYSVESLYYHPQIIKRIASKQTQVFGGDADALVDLAIRNAVAEVKQHRRRLVDDAVVRRARNQVFQKLPNRKTICDAPSLEIQVDVAALQAELENDFDALIQNVNWDGLLARFPIRQTPAFDRVVDALKITNRETYRDAVLKLLQDDFQAVGELRKLLSNLYETVNE